MTQRLSSQEVARRVQESNRRQYTRYTGYTAMTILVTFFPASDQTRVTP